MIYNKYKEIKRVIEINTNTNISKYEYQLELIDIIEGLIFVVGEQGIDIDTLVSTTKFHKTDIYDCLDKLTNKYSNGSIVLTNYGGIYKLLTTKNMKKYIDTLFNSTKMVNISQSALETLAIIAYKQPIEKVEIEEIRGVSCDHMIKKLVSRNLIRECGRSQSPGRPYLYEITEYFLDSFKLNSIEDLPDLDVFYQQTTLFNQD